MCNRESHATLKITFEVCLRFSVKVVYYVNI